MKKNYNYGYFSSQKTNTKSLKARIYVVHCSETFAPHSDVLVHVQAGKALSKDDLGFQGDDTRDNISIKTHNKKFKKYPKNIKKYIDISLYF